MDIITLDRLEAAFLVIGFVLVGMLIGVAI